MKNFLKQCSKVIKKTTAGQVDPMGKYVESSFRMPIDPKLSKKAAKHKKKLEERNS